MPETVKATAPFSALLMVVSVIVSVSGAPRSAEVSRSIEAPLAKAVLPASSVTLRTELIGPSASVDRLAVPAEARTVTEVVPSENVTVASAPATSASMPETVKATAVFSALLMVVSVIDSVSGAPRSAEVSRSIEAPLAEAVLPASSVTLRTELIGPSASVDRLAVPAEARTVTEVVPSENVTVASAPATSASMPETVKATAVFSALLMVVSVIDSVSGAPRSAEVSRSIEAPLAEAVLPASSVTLRTELIGPSASVDRLAVPAEARTVTEVVPSENVTVASAPATSASMPETVKATAVFSALLMVVSVIDSVSGAPRSAEVSRSIAAPLAEAVLPASSVTLRTELIGPSASVDRLAVPAEARTVTEVVPSENVTVASAPATSASMPETVKATAVFSALLMVVSVIDSVSGAPRSAEVSRSIAAPLAEAVLPASSVTLRTELIGPSASVDRLAVPAEARTVTEVVPSENVTVASAPATSASMPETVKATAVFSALLMVVSVIDSVSGAPRSAEVSRSIAAPLAEAVLPASSVTLRTELIGPSASVDRLAVPAEARTVTEVVPSENVTVASAPATSASMPETVKATAVFSALLMVVSVIDSVSGAPRSAEVSRSIEAPLAEAVLPASSVTLRTELIGPSASVDRLAVPAEARTVTEVVPSENVTVASAPATSASMPETVKATAVFSALLMVVSVIDSVSGAPRSAEVSRSIEAPLAEAVLPASSVTLRTELIGPSASVDRLAVPAEARTVTEVVPSENVTVASAPATSASMPETVKATAVFSALLMVVSVIDSVSGAPRSAEVSRSIAAPLAEAVLPASSVTLRTELIGPSASVDRLAVPAEARTVTEVVPSENVTVASAPATSASMPETVKATAVFSALLMVVSVIDSVSGAPRSAEVSRSIEAPLAEAVLPASSVTLRTELIGPSASVDRLAVPAEARTVTEVVPSENVTVASAPATSASMPETVKATAVFSALLMVVSVIDSVSGAPRSAEVSRSIEAPLAEAVLPASSVTLRTELIGPSASVDRLAVPAEARTVTEVVPSENVTVASAPATSASMPETVKATAVFSALLMVVSVIDSVSGAPRSAEVSRSIEAPLAEAVLPASSVTLRTELIGPSASVDRLAVPAEARTVTEVVPSENVTVASAPATSASMPETVKATAVFSALLMVVSVIDSVSGAPRSAEVSRSIEAPLAEAVLPASSVTLRTELIGPSASVDRLAVPAEARTVTEVVPSENVTVASAPATSASMPETVKATAVFSALLMVVSVIDSVSGAPRSAEVSRSIEAPLAEAVLPASSVTLRTELIGPSASVDRLAVPAEARTVTEVVPSENVTVASAPATSASMPETVKATAVFSALLMVVSVIDSVSGAPRSAEVSRSIEAPLAEAVLPASSVTLRTELIGPSASVDRLAVPAEARTVTEVVPSENVTVASAPATSASMPETVKATAVFSALLMVVSVIDSVSGAPRSAEVSRSIEAPLAEAVLPASSVTLRTELIGPSASVDRLAVPAEARTVTEVVPSENVTVASAPATSASMPETVKATAVFSALLMVVSVIDSVSGAPRSAEVSRSIEAPLAEAVLPASSVTLRTELIGPSASVDRLAVPAEARTVTEVVPSENVTVASAPATSASMPETVKATAVFSALLMVVSVIDSVSGAPRSAEVSRSIEAPLAEAVLPASSVTLRTELIGPSASVDRLAVPAEARTVTEVVPSENVTVASAPATSASMPETVKATAVFSALLMVVSVIDSVSG